jgi:transposase
VITPALQAKVLEAGRRKPNDGSTHWSWVRVLSPGTLSLYAAHDVRSGKVQGKTAARHTSEEFVAFLAQVVGACRPKQEIHVILDNLSAHKTAQVQVFLDEHPNVHLHFTPTYSSWLNQVEIWFGRIEREVIARGVFTSVRDLRAS